MSALGDIVLSTLIDGLLEEIKRQKNLEDKCDALRNSLPAKLEKINEALGKEPCSEKLVQDYIARIKGFNKTVQDHKRTRTVWRCFIGKRATKARESFKAFENELTKFTEEIRHLRELVLFRNLKITAQVSDKVEAVGDAVENARDEMKVVSETTAENHHMIAAIITNLALFTNPGARVKMGSTRNLGDAADKTWGQVKAVSELDLKKLQMITAMEARVALLRPGATLMTGSTRNLGERAATLSSMNEKLETALATLRSGSKKEKAKAEKVLVQIALRSVGDSDEFIQAIGVMTLNELVAHSSGRNIVMDNPSTVRTLINLAIERPGDKSVRWILDHLVERADLFFAQLEPLSKDARYYPVIAATGLVAWIVKSAQPTARTENRKLQQCVGDENALRILLEIAKCNECKPAIAEAGGIAVLVATYSLLKMSEVNMDPRIVGVINALEALAMDTTYREKFAQAHGEWPLLHFVWRCGTVPPWRYVYDDDGFKVQDRDSIDSSVVDDCKTPTNFDRAIVFSAESAAGHALWTLAAQDDAWRHHLLYLGALYVRSPGVCNLGTYGTAATGELEKHHSRFDAFWGWLRLANHVEENHVEELFEDSEWTFWSFPVVWSLLMDESTSFTAAEWHFGEALQHDWAFGNDGAVFAVVETKYGPYIKWRDNFSCMRGDRLCSGCRRCTLRPASEKLNPAVQHKVISTFEPKLISSIYSYLSLPLEKCKSLSVCWKKTLQQLEGDECDQKARALSVLWLCSDFEEFLAIERKYVARLVKVCEQVVANERVNDVFWATCLILGMISKLSRCRRFLDLFELATMGVAVLLKSSEWTKFIFLAKYMLVREEPELKRGDMRRASIPFLVRSFQKLQQEDEWLDPDSYFQSNRYHQLKPDKTATKMSRTCLNWLGNMWPKHKTKITAEGGTATLKAMLKCDDVGADYKSDIKQALRQKASNTIEMETQLTVLDVAPWQAREAVRAADRLEGVRRSTQGSHCVCEREFDQTDI